MKELNVGDDRPLIAGFGGRQQRMDGRYGEANPFVGCSTDDRECTLQVKP